MKTRYGSIAAYSRLKITWGLLFVAFASGCHFAEPHDAHETTSDDERWSATVLTASLKDSSLETFQASSRGLVRGSVWKDPKKGAFVEDIAVSPRNRRVFVLCAPRPGQRVVRTYEVATAGSLRLIRETPVRQSARAMVISPSGRALALVEPGLRLQVYRLQADGGLSESGSRPDRLSPNMRTGLEVSVEPGGRGFFALFSNSGLDSSETFVGAFLWNRDETSVRQTSTPLHTDFEEEPILKALALPDGTALLSGSDGISRLSVASRRPAVAVIAKDVTFETGFALTDGSALLIDGNGKAITWTSSDAASAFRQHKKFPEIVSPALYAWVSPGGHSAIIVSGSDRGYVGLYGDPLGSPSLVGPRLVSRLTGGTVKAAVMPNAYP